MDKIFVFRNYTVEPLFKGMNCSFSGYDNISDIDDNADLYVWFYLLPIKNNIDALIQEVEDYHNRVEIILSILPKNKTKIFFTINSIDTINWENSNNELQCAINNYNEFIYSKSKEDNSIKIIDFTDFTSQYNIDSLIDWKYFYMSQIVINPKLAVPFNNWFKNKLNAILFLRKKCLVLDLDNTLWGGILGEDGISGIKLGNSYPGNIYLEFQNNIKLASKSGIILAVCSKNNEKDVFDLWDKHTNIILKKDDFSVLKINWNNKADNIIEIANELNIGLDSMVFIDDNPSERALVKLMIPDIEVPEFPKKIYELNKFFKNVYNRYFQVYQLTNEDTKKTEQYKINAKRSDLKKNISFDDYIKSLETVVEVQELDDINLNRISQMTNKTNQFNLTTKRYTSEDILSLKQEGAIIKCISVKDRFGDNGITGLIILIPSENMEEITIDTFLLSCRILGRGVEQTFLKYIINGLIDSEFKVLRSSYIKSNKNQQVESFYNKFGLEEIDSDNGVVNYKYLLSQKHNIDNKVKIINNER